MSETPEEGSPLPKTPYERVELINKIAGNYASGNWSDIHRQFKIFFSEVVELAEGIDNRDVKMTRDGAADVRVTIYGLQFLLGCAGDKDFHDVADALMSRFDRDYDNAVLTSIKYRDRGVPTMTRETQVEGVYYYATIVAEDCVDKTNGEALPKGKFLKSHAYRKEELEPLADRFADRLMETVDAGEGFSAVRHAMDAMRKSLEKREQQ